jgi:hypothetical protein
MNRIIIDSWDERLGLAFLMVGIRGRVRSSSQGADQVEATSRLITMEHQFGGYSCLHEDVTGVVFRVEDAPARTDLKPLLGGIGSISESAAPPEYPVDRRLEAFGYTSGEALPAKRRQRGLHGLPADSTLHPGVGGVRRAVPVEPRVLSRWPTWSLEGRGRLDDELLDQLVAATAISRQPLGLYLLWYNSD